MEAQRRQSRPYFVGEGTSELISNLISYKPEIAL